MNLDLEQNLAVNDVNGLGDEELSEDEKVNLLRMKGHLRHLGEVHQFFLI